MMQMLKAWLPQKLMARALVILVIPVLLIQAISLYVFYDRHLSYIMKQSAADIAGGIAIINESVGNKRKPEALSTFQRYFAMKATVIQDPWVPGQTSDDEWLNTVLTTQLSHFIPKDQFYIVFLEDDVDIYIKKTAGTLKISFIKKRLYSRTIPLFIMWTLGATLFMVGIAFLFTRKQVRIIENLSDAADQLGRGYDIDDIKPTGAFEIRHLTASFNLMQHRLNKMISQRKEMLVSISNDLQKPIARLRSVLERQPQQESFTQSYQDIQGVEAMLAGYLAFAGADKPEPLRLVCIDDILQGARHISITPESIQIQGDLGFTFMTMPTKLTHCLFHIMDNGCRFAGSLVEVTVRRNAKSIYITVDDDGDGAPEHLYSDLFRPFFKMPNPVSDGHEGVGLGLAIAQNAVNQLGGSIVLSPSPLGGLRVSIELPDL